MKTTQAKVPLLPSLLIPLFVIIALFSGLFLKHGRTPEEILGKIPVQSGGRIKPFDTFAREVLLSATGKPTFGGESATATIWKWIANPEAWYRKSFIPVKYEPLRKELSIMVIGGKITPEIVLTNPPFQQKVKEVLQKEERKEPLTQLEKKRTELFEKGRIFQAVAQGFHPGFIPDPENPNASWFPVEALSNLEGRSSLEGHYSSYHVAQFEAALGGLVEAWQGEGKGNLLDRAKAFSLSLDTLLASQGILLDKGKIQMELVYNRLHPFRWASILYLVSGIAWFFLKDRFPSATFGLFASGFVMHTVGFVFRCLIAGRPPVSNMYESVIWVAWAVVLFSIALLLFYRNSILAQSAAWVAAFALLIGESFPGLLDPSLSPLVPVLRSNYWLTIHVLTITLSYGAFLLAWGLGHANLISFAFRPEKEKEHEELGGYVYRALQIGVVLLAAGTILGGVWANDSWGRFWGWDPKETWALIALFGYLAVLHARYVGWIEHFGTAVGAVVAFLGILMAWYGVNFVLAAGLHSYGFGDGGLHYVLAVVGIDLLFVSYLAFRFNTHG